MVPKLTRVHLTNIDKHMVGSIRPTAIGIVFDLLMDAWMPVLLSSTISLTTLATKMIGNCFPAGGNDEASGSSIDLPRVLTITDGSLGDILLHAKLLPHALFVDKGPEVGGAAPACFLTTLWGPIYSIKR